MRFLYEANETSSEHLASRISSTHALIDFTFEEKCDTTEDSGY
jgi:hypothetical protein